MQEHDRSIFKADPPFLVIYANKQWKVALEILPHPKGAAFIEPYMENDPDQAIILPGTPWHIGDNVWEFDYATQVMTLDHPNYHNHPAWRLWLHWLKSRDEKEEIRLH